MILVLHVAKEFSGKGTVLQTVKPRTTENNGKEPNRDPHLGIFLIPGETLKTLAQNFEFVIDQITSLCHLLSSLSEQSEEE